MIFRNGYPGIVSGEYGYFQAVEWMGFVGAHRQMLKELKRWFDVNRPHQSYFLTAMEAYRVHRSFLRLVSASWGQGRSARLLDRMFAEVFGYSGWAVVDGNLPRASFLQDATNGNWDLPQKRRVRSKAEVLNSIQYN